MQLDKTRIGVRERGMNETFDLALHVLRKYWSQLVAPLAIGILPCAVLNYFLTARYLDPIYNGERVVAFYWVMIALVFFQSQLATSLATLYLGRSVFNERLALAELVSSWGEMWFQMLWCQGCLRLVIPAMIVIVFIQPETDGEWFFHFLLVVMVVIAALVRSLRPYINEVILLERNPFWGANEHQLTLTKRSNMLHDSSRSGELFGRWLGAAALAGLLSLSLLLGVIYCIGLLIDEWTFTPFIAHVAFPSVLWLVASYLAVVRYLSYLDLRIRMEGWEVELKLRAEGLRWTQNIS